MLESTKTISWSLMPGIALHLLINDGRFVKNTSRRIWPLVGKLMDCIRPKSEILLKAALHDHIILYFYLPGVLGTLDFQHHMSCFCV
jgi:hypothetical protein